MCLMSKLRTRLMYIFLATNCETKGKDTWNESLRNQIMKRDGIKIRQM